MLETQNAYNAAEEEWALSIFSNNLEIKAEGYETILICTWSPKSLEEFRRLMFSEYFWAGDGSIAFRPLLCNSYIKCICMD